MRNILLVIRADFGTYLAVDMPLNEATDYIQKHKDGNLPPIIGGSLPNGGSWSVESKKIVLLHTQELETVQQTQQHGQLPYKASYGPKFSGY